MRTNSLPKAFTASASRRGFILGSAAVSGALVVGFAPENVGAQGAAGPAGAGVHALHPHRFRRESDDPLRPHGHGAGDLSRPRHAGERGAPRRLVADRRDRRIGRSQGLRQPGMGRGDPGHGRIDRHRLLVRPLSARGRSGPPDARSGGCNDWKVPAGEIVVERGVVRHGTRQASFGSLAGKAAALPVPTNVRLREAKDWSFIGKDRDVLGKFDSLPKTTGRQDFTIDVKLPGLLTAVMIHPPLFGATVNPSTPPRRRPCAASLTWCRRRAAWPWWPTTCGGR